MNKVGARGEGVRMKKRREFRGEKREGADRELNFSERIHFLWIYFPIILSDNILISFDAFGWWAWLPYKEDKIIIIIIPNKMVGTLTPILFFFRK